MSINVFSAGVLGTLALFSVTSAAMGDTGFMQKGTASYYADRFHGKKTASGEPYQKEALTAAHKTLPLGTKARITNLKNGKSVVVKVNDRGPHTKGHIVDLSWRAARELGMIRAGLAQVRVEAVDSGDGA